MMTWQPHQHVPTGKVRQCETEGCQESWPVTCHNGRRRRCERHQAAERRKADRQAKAARRKAHRADQELAEEMFGRPFREITDDVAGMTYEQAREYLRCLEDELEYLRCLEDEAG